MKAPNNTEPVADVFLLNFLEAQGTPGLRWVCYMSTTGAAIEAFMDAQRPDRATQRPSGFHACANCPDADECAERGCEDEATTTDNGECRVPPRAVTPAVAWECDSRPLADRCQGSHDCKPRLGGVVRVNAPSAPQADGATCTGSEGAESGEEMEAGGLLSLPPELCVLRTPRGLNQTGQHPHSYGGYTTAHLRDTMRDTQPHRFKEAV